jgi:beta-lactamase superfamily II metal-dependent hydrolase
MGTDRHRGGGLAIRLALGLLASCGGDDGTSAASTGDVVTSTAPTGDGTANVTSSDDVATGSTPPTTTSNPTEGGSADSTGGSTGGTSGGVTGSMDIYWVDTEGGAATLIVTPDGPLILVDAGNPGDRDPDRIAAVVQREIGAAQIDLCIVTHYHSDHVGGVPGLEARVPVVEYWDHGDSVEAGGGGGLALWQDYLAVASRKRTVVSAGETHTVGGLQLSIVSANGQTIDAPLPGAGGANPACEGAANMPVATDENPMSVGFRATWGTFDFLDLGDLTWSFEDDLACRANLIGPVDLYQTTHHGLAISGAEQLVHGIDPIVAVMNNGPHKGGAPEAFDIVTTAPSAPDLWMLHRALDTDAAHNSEDDLIANPGEGAADEGHFVHAHIEASGAFTITNGRNGHSRAYQAR